MHQNSRDFAINVPIENQISMDSVAIILTRGAFHNDSLILKGNSLVYLPSPDMVCIEAMQNDYFVKSTTLLADSTVYRLIAKLTIGGVFDLEHHYATSWSCTSLTKVDVKIGQQQTTITSDDWRNDCPELLIWLEDELVELHGKGLKRVYLPG